MKLELACGQRLSEGYIGVDYLPLEELFPEGAPAQYAGYQQVDLLSFPWPFDTSSIDEVHTEHFVEHIPHWRPGWDVNNDGWWLFFAELYRIMKPGGAVTVVHPFSRSDRAFWDQTHTRYIHTYSWLYLSKAARAEQRADHYTSREVDFSVAGFEPTPHPTFAGRELDSDDGYSKALEFDFNVWQDLKVTLRVLKEG